MLPAYHDSVPQYDSLRDFRKHEGYRFGEAPYDEDVGNASAPLERFSLGASHYNREFRLVDLTNVKVSGYNNWTELARLLEKYPETPAASVAQIQM
jgi:hypothetical protein